MSWCPEKCQTCHKEVNTECCKRVIKAHTEAELIWKVQAGPFPAFAPETELEPKFKTDDTRGSEAMEDGTLEDVFEEGDCLFYMKLPTEAEFIWATQTTSY